MRQAWRHPWNVTPARAREIQEIGRSKIANAKRARLSKEGLARFGVLAAVDVAYDAATDHCFAALVVWDVAGGRVIEAHSNAAPSTFPYVPGLLSFREIPPLLPLFQKLRRAPDLILCDGQGLAHPRRFGLACHLGAVYGIPSVGWAKSRLIGEFEPHGARVGAATPLVDKGEQVGWAFRSRAGCNPTFVSPGFGVTLEESLAVARTLLGAHRLCEPARAAHALTREALAAGRERLKPEGRGGRLSPA